VKRIVGDFTLALSNLRVAAKNLVAILFRPGQETIFLTRAIPLCVITIGTEVYSLAQQYVFNLIKPGYMFQLYSHHQAYVQSLVELCMLDACVMWDPSSEAEILQMELKT
jgi:hypothetical protein